MSLSRRNQIVLRPLPKLMLNLVKFSSEDVFHKLASKQRNIDKIAQELKAKRQMETNVKVI